MRGALRAPLAALLWPVVRPFQRLRDRGLRPGITAVVAARDEGYAIRFCLRSLVGVADQVVCIDNGSRDDTLDVMEAFRDEHRDRLAVDVVALPDALLGECRDEGLRRTRHRWHLRWDADMVAKGAMRELRAEVLSNERPRAIALPRTNLIGDLRHTHKLQPVVDPGEPILVRFGSGIRYREYGKFDAVRLPLHYAQRQEQSRYYFHLAGLKPDDNLIHRFHYFAWRELVNTRDAALDPRLRDFDEFKRIRNAELFGTNDPRSLKFRYRRQLCYHLASFDPARYGDYPEVLADELSGRQRFEVVYRDGRPWTRIDHEDHEMLGYTPTEEDLAWDPEALLRRLLGPDDCRVLGIAPA
jgi:glycosyltransferase involved in cell wall biosynthesis